jgi:hypothetical protein
VFVSSTDEDLKPWRAAVKTAILKAEFTPNMMEDWSPNSRPSVEECRRRVEASDLVIVLVAHRYGWIPERPDNLERKSITWLECDCARAQGIDVLPFVVDEKAAWPRDLIDDVALAAVAVNPDATAEDLARARVPVARLKALKAELSQGIVEFFTTPEDLGARVAAALGKWKPKRIASGRTATAAVTRARSTKGAAADPTVYLEALMERTGYIDIRGLHVGGGRAHRFPIEDLYIGVSTSRRLRAEADDRAHVPLQEALAAKRLVVIGDPGSGKTTFLHRVAHMLSRARLIGDAEPAKGLGFTDPVFPILIRFTDLHEHRHHCRTNGVVGAPTVARAPGWISHYLATASANAAWGLDRPFFDTRLKSVDTIVLLDGLDELPTRQARTEARDLIEAEAANAKCRFVVSSRPGAQVEDDVLAGFEQARIEPLSEAAIATFLRRWSEALHGGATAAAQVLESDLRVALELRPDIRLMVETPVMLTALAVVHWHERRLPEQRADLYESVLRWLARARQQKPGRLSADRCLEILQVLALGMFRHPNGRQTQIPFADAARMLQGDGLPGGRAAR